MQNVTGRMYGLCVGYNLLIYAWDYGNKSNFFCFRHTVHICTYSDSFIKLICDLQTIALTQVEQRPRHMGSIAFPCARNLHCCA